VSAAPTATRSPSAPKTHASRMTFRFRFEGEDVEVVDA
jgi:hypothetical protein